MLAVTPFSGKKEASKNNNNIVAVREDKPEPELLLAEAEDKAGDQHCDDQKHKEKCNICQSKVVKPIVETDISRAASSFAKDSTLIKYRYCQSRLVFLISNPSSASVGGMRRQPSQRRQWISRQTSCRVGNILEKISFEIFFFVQAMTTQQIIFLLAYPRENKNCKMCFKISKFQRELSTSFRIVNY